MNALQRTLAVALIIGAGGAAGFLSYRLMPAGSGGSSLSTAPASAPTAAVEVPAADAAATAGEQGPAGPIPDELPDLSLPDLSGTTRSLRGFGKRPLILNFWATWCAPCRHEIPLLRELRQRHRADRLEVVGIAVDFAAAVREYLQHTPIDYPLLDGERDGLAAAERFGMRTALPFSVFADARGRIVALKVGELHAEEADFILGEIQSLDAGRISIPAARERIATALRDLSSRRARMQHNPG